MSSAIFFQKTKTKPASDERYTPAKFVEACRKVVGSFDLDPASCKEANMVVKADQIYTKLDDGLSKDWFGSVWCNPPYSREAGGVAAWVEKAIGEVDSGRCSVAIMLLNSNTSSRFFQRLAGSDMATVCFLNKRISFYEPGGSVLKNPVASNILALISRSDEISSQFIKEISDLGIVMKSFNTQ